MIEVLKTITGCYFEHSDKCSRSCTRLLMHHLCISDGADPNVCVYCRLEFKEEMLRKRFEEEVGSLAEERAKQEAEEHHSLMAWNDAENLRLRKIR